MRIFNFNKFFESKSNQYNWMILYEDRIHMMKCIGIDGNLPEISWHIDMDAVYQYLKENLFYHQTHNIYDWEIENTNIPYNEWVGWDNVYHIYMVGGSKSSFMIDLDSGDCWNDFLNFYNEVPLNESRVSSFKVFENSNTQYNWLITHQDHESGEDFILWCEDMEGVYRSIQGNLFLDEDDEITETNIPYSDWCDSNTYINIYKYGQNDPAFEIHLQSDDCWNDFLNFYNSVPLNESFFIDKSEVDELDAYTRVIESKNKFPNIKKMEIDGFEILMGKDAESNDYLTMQMRKDGDLWFHVHGFPGSHIILRCGSRIPDQNTKKKVAELAAKNSKAAGLATVICCPINLVSKEPSSVAGKVKVENSLNVEKIDINL